MACHLQDIKPSMFGGQSFDPYPSGVSTLGSQSEKSEASKKKQLTRFSWKTNKPVHAAYVASKNAGQWQLLVEVGRNQIVVIHARCFALHGLSDQRWALQSRGTLQMEQWTIVNKQ